MLKKNFFLIVLIFLFSFQNYSFAENKIAYVDLDYILSNTNIGKQIFNNLKKEENLKFEELNSVEQNLKDEENKILASKNIISNDEFKKRVEKFKIKIEDFKLTKKQEIDKLKQNRNSEVTNLINSINSIIEKYMFENSISIILDKKNVYIADKSYDITNNLIELINKNIK